MCVYMILFNWQIYSIFTNSKMCWEIQCKPSAEAKRSLDYAEAQLE